MGLLRDRRAPTELNGRQKEELQKDVILVSLCKDRAAYRQQLYEEGFYPLEKAKGITLYKNYEETKRKIGSIYQRLYREHLDKAIREFHDSVDTIKVARQLSGKAAGEVLTLPAAEFELKERATIASMLFRPFENDKTRVEFVRTSARLCQLQETRQPKALKRKMEQFVAVGDNGVLSLRKCSKGHPSLEVFSLPQCRNGETVDHDPGASRSEEPKEVQCQHTYPIVLHQPVCLICIGNKEFTYDRRMRHIPRKDVLNKHVETHFRLPEYQMEFQCRHPHCCAILHGVSHFKRHALEIHGVSH
ncbi:uncharacterized protein EKO05_0008727 [Ascochyta rabiei]|uniref:Metal ion binding n=1 Tax=Didymella rabiei TaxID=5454 RepID=A0A163KW80_DIDRA|nr:uncharacterized protein EKO05_0008727 [Ascochyta rabiei]KZM27296.1 metal ion binding [Ascochyta rabiei]UPX18427.1 hypothetical protein EKO05_0008727 [Ascochyta rabiei]